MFINRILVVSSALILLAGTQRIIMFNRRTILKGIPLTMFVPTQTTNTDTDPAITTSTASTTLATPPAIARFSIEPIFEATQASSTSQHTEASDPRNGLNHEEPEPTSGLWKEALAHPFLTLAIALSVLKTLLWLTRGSAWLHGAVLFAAGAVGLALLPQWTYMFWMPLVMSWLWVKLRHQMMLGMEV